MAEARLLEQVKGLGDVYSVEAPFDEQLLTLNERGIRYPISIRDASYLRLYGQNKGGMRTCHAPILAKNSPVIIARISPLVKDIKMVRQAVNAHRKGEFPSFSVELYSQWNDIAEKDKSKKPENRRAIILSERGDYKVHRDSDEVRFFWQSAREKYFARFAPEGSIQVYQIAPITVDSQNGTIINYTWFDSLEDGSGLSFGDRDLDGGDRTFGVLKKTSEAGSRSGKASLPYTIRQIEREIRRLSGLEAELACSRAFLESLRKK